MDRGVALQRADEVLTVAHRGGAHLRPENTIAAFDHAVDLGVDALELDIQRTADGTLVVIRRRDR
ncbi:MAG: glycerophosphodiester phosphodiesterase family protein [Natrialbaceae archaeon]|nr:glycerophosphodiester phosphodiesterase family protein [Natrialbaceae archaeon]